MTNAALAKPGTPLALDLRGPAFVALLLVIACGIVWLNAAVEDGALFGNDPCAAGQSGIPFENADTSTNGTLCLLDD